jgi:hypothetical protein
MIHQDLYGTQARCLYEIGSYGESRDRESEARGTGWELTFKRVLPDMEGCEGIWTNMEGGVLMQRNEAERDDHRGRKLN